MTVSVASAKPTGRGPLQPAVRPYTPASPLPVLLEKEPTVSKKLEEGTMYAVIKTGGKQYRVQTGDKIFVEKLPGNVGDAVSFDQVLMLGGEALKLGKPLVSGAKVEAKILEHGRGEKVIIFKFRRRKNYRRKTGHRQPFTTLQITDIKA